MLRKDITYTVDDNGCWNCTSHKPTTHGYFQIRIKWKLILVHRYMYEKEFGPIKKGNIIRHTCDNTKCINPYHLLEGTQADNMRDMRNRGREAKGVKNGHAVLNEQQVLEIFNDTNPHLKIAEKYGIAKSTISSIKTGRNWKHITNHLNN